MSEPANDPYGSKVLAFPPARFERPPGGQPPLDPPGQPPHDSGMEWQPAIDRVSDKLDGQFKWLIGAYGAGFMVLLAAFAAGFMILLTRSDASFERLSAKIDTTTATLSAKIDNLDAKIDTMGERTARLEGAAAK